LAKAGVDAIAKGRERVKANPEAGSSLVLHKDSPRQEAWQRLKETNPLLVKFGELKQSFDESENPFVTSVRGVTQTIGSWFEENETAQVMRAMKAIDPTFSMGVFERELREYIVPEVVDAYLSADKESLQKWCSEAVSMVMFRFINKY
jgi:mitochondrial import inner membrane translocase subunit TIM44